MQSTVGKFFRGGDCIRRRHVSHAPRAKSLLPRGRGPATHRSIRKDRPETASWIRQIPVQHRAEDELVIADYERGRKERAAPDIIAQHYLRARAVFDLAHDVVPHVKAVDGGHTGMIICSVRAGQLQ